ncbi:uncharacterized protein LOC111709457 isoform X2 [Eurytemora carolleeae]|uniref:uncharacterized protein LOC111709457 isoform X2 n=1 Tax=Eurytemora carolleeae TaxID=1294199 RepID=UPI000C75AE10|nr:uncharacterized protein LOC111709457 isoform X2 [Eurytemora carolleeae]|eukprot:XP_023338897.1 uncharacterized protein LOC111709457 isoform X2 [Eurytemora affinis]
MLVNTGTQEEASHLSAYPYLFVRETEQADYFCTVCEESLKESQLQDHLFQGHSALNLKNCFVKLGKGGKSLVVCVICWAKIDSHSDMSAHREACKANYPEEEQQDSGNPTSVISTPDIHDMMEDDERDLNGVSPPPFPQPEVILDTEVGIKYEPGRDTSTLYSDKMDGYSTGSREPVYTSQCMQCSLCSMILPSSSYLSHLRAYHRVTCPLNQLSCPLCMALVPIMDLTVHLASQHGLVPQTAVNALLLWVLTSNTFSLNDEAQASLKSKFKNGNSRSKPPVSSTPLSSSTPIKSTPSNPVVYKPTGVPKIELDTFPSPSSSSLDIRGKVGLEELMDKLTRSHLGPGGKESHQCLVCAKWYAVPPIKHMRSHILTLRQERRKIVQLTNSSTICLICYRTFESMQAAAQHMATHTDNGGSSNGATHITIPGLPGGSLSPVSSSLVTSAGGLLAEALRGFPLYTKPKKKDTDDLPLGATFKTTTSMTPKVSKVKDEVNIELDNAGRVKSGKVRKQCELCGEWSNIKWFFKHMSEVHQALFCRCCREYLPKEEHKEHRHWHGMPPYMGQKIRIEDGQPIIIDRKERASLTPIGSLAAWGGSSGGLVVKAVDEINRKRKLERTTSPNGSVKTSGSSTNGDSSYQFGMLPPDGSAGRESLMPKERCPVCSIEITHKNLARHIKLRHGIKYKFCHKCRKLIPGEQYTEHKKLHESGELPTISGFDYLDSLEGGEDGVIEIPEEVLDEVMETGSNGCGKRKDDSFRANTSMTKLESLMGKEFKHPRRKCNICGYSVSYSNYKRHLRNAHPGLGEDLRDNTDSGGDNEGDMLGHHMDDSDRISDNTIGDEMNGSREDEDEEEVNGRDEEYDEEGYTECIRCGDHVMSEFMENHLRKIHGESTRKSGSPRQQVSDPCILRMCPECSVEMREDCIIKHCRVEHKVEYKFCIDCSKYIPKKLYKVHVRLHEKGDLERGVEEQDMIKDEDSNMENNAAESCEIEMKDDISDLKENEESESENYLVIDSV